MSQISCWLFVSVLFIILATLEYFQKKKNVDFFPLVICFGLFFFLSFFLPCFLSSFLVNYFIVLYLIISSIFSFAVGFSFTFLEINFQALIFSLSSLLLYFSFCFVMLFFLCCSFIFRITSSYIAQAGLEIVIPLLPASLVLGLQELCQAHLFLK